MLSIENMNVRFDTPDGQVQAVSTPTPLKQAKLLELLESQVREKASLSSR